MAHPVRGANNGSFTASHSFLTALRCASFKGDEGYSEDTRSQSEGDTQMRSDFRLSDVNETETDANPVLPDWLLSLSENERSEITYLILRTLRTSSIASIVDRLNPLLHLDPVAHLPPEITFLIFSYLTPDNLLRTSTLSKSWRHRALDSQLWRLLFKLEGWTANLSKVREFEMEERTRRLSLRERKSRARAADGDTERQVTKKRVYDGGIFGEGPTPMNVEESPAATGGWAEQHGTVEADESPMNSPDRMQDISFHSPSTTVRGEPHENNHLMNTGFGRQYDTNSPLVELVSDLNTTQAPVLPLDPPAQPSLLIDESSELPRVNWHYLYKQKRRLEENWNAGRFVNFQFPHPDYAHEAHTECVYTIQYSDKHLVSGSRDKSVRIWDMETHRLVRPPLLGHSASVLCLQFDDRPEEDVVITGGSDCHVLIWRFSTGQLIKKLPKAHSESVLNLRFDENYLITCSKDKTIKVWNRKQLLPTDDVYPSSTRSAAKFPSYIIDMAQATDLQRTQLKPLPAYSLIMTLEGHSAAVNAIQIYDQQIVSASGDRTVKIWDVKTGSCIKTVPGHSKGIACVQFDGRRIVSGSSDESVRIFDRKTGAEVACLVGHSNLVRTVQASFGDLPGNEEELEAEAKKVDLEYFQARQRGLLEGNSMTRERRRARNAGSRDPRDLFAYGAKLPPGGGTNRWARIVSGSYDESVIIWKKDQATGNWVIARTLMQIDAVRSANGRTRRPTPGGHHPHNHNNQQNLANSGQATQGGQQQQQQPQNAGNDANVTAQQAANQLATVQANFQALAAQAHAQVAHAQMLAQQAQALQQQAHNAQAAQTSSNDSNTVQTGGQQTQDAATNTQQTGSSNPQQPVTQQQIQAQLLQQAQAQAQNPQQQQQQNQGQQHHHHHHGPHGHHHHHHHHNLGPLGVQQGSNSRVFKLQFDARRIICCSQEPTIVGWDFANGDRDIMSASHFFGEIS